MPQLDPDNLPDGHDFDDDGNIVDADGSIVADPDGNEIKDDVRDLRAAANRSKKHKTQADNEKARADAAERKLAVVSAIGALDSPLKVMFADSYKGDTDAESVNAAFASVTGAPAGEAEQVETEGAPSEAELAQQREREAIATGAEAQTGERPQRPVKETARATSENAIAQGASREEAIGGYINALAQAAANGDTSVLVQDPEHV